MPDNALFIPPGTDLKKGDKALRRFVDMDKTDLRKRWQTRAGQRILVAWRDSDFDRQVLDGLIGRYYGHSDIRGIDLSGESLQGADLSEVDLFAATLRGTHLERTDLSNSWLSESDIRGAVFDFANMDSALVDTVLFDTATSLRHVNLNAINFTMRPLLQDLAIGQQRIADLEANHRIVALLLRISCDYGRSFGRFFFWVFLLIAAFGLLYTLPGTTSATGIGDNLYFSVVTFTTLGYGDFGPVSWLGKALVVIEVMLGYVMLGLLVGIISRRVIGR